MNRLEQLLGMLAKNPDDVFLNFSLGMEYKAADRLEEATQQFERVLAMDPHYLAGYIRKGEVLTSRQLFDEARKVLEDGLHVADHLGEAHMADNIHDMLKMLP